MNNTTKTIFTSDHSCYLVIKSMDETSSPYRSDQRFHVLLPFWTPPSCCDDFHPERWLQAGSVAFKQAETNSTALNGSLSALGRDAVLLALILPNFDNDFQQHQ